MGQLDKLIERLQSRQEILLETGKEPTLRTDGGTRVMVNQQLQTPQILSLLLEIAPAAQKELVTRKKQTGFEYVLNGKTYAVRFMAQGELVRSVISLPDNKEEPKAAATDDEIEVIQEEDETPTAPAPSVQPAGREPEINLLLRKMFGMNASDLHLTANHKPMVRLHGDMLELLRSADDRTGADEEAGSRDHAGA